MSLADILINWAVPVESYDKFLLVLQHGHFSKPQRP